METIVDKKKTLAVIINMYDFHTKLFNNVLVDVTDKDAQNRLNTKANHMAWIAGSIVHGRYALAKVLGVNASQAGADLFKDFKGIQEGETYPTLEQYKKDWQSISDQLKTAINGLSEEELSKPDPFEMPGDFTLFDTIVFSTDRESYAIGQLGLYRRLLDYPAMKYD